MASSDAPPGSPPCRFGALADPVLGVIVAVAAFFLFWSLDGRCLWQDEAETALLGRSILRHGIPVAYDGKNLISQEGGREYGPDYVVRLTSRLQFDYSGLMKALCSRPEYVWRWSPWVQFYLAAASLGALGETSTLAARLPFALLGLLTVPLTYLLALRLTGSRAVARLSALFLTFTVTFLLHARQARWHAPDYFLFVCLLFTLLGVLEGRKVAVAGFVATGVLLFYTNYFTAIGLLFAVLPALAFLQPGRSVWRRLAFAYAIIGLFIIPGIYFHDIFGKGDEFRPLQSVLQLKLYIVSCLTFMLPLSLLVLLVGLVFGRKSWMSDTERRSGRFLLALSLVYLVYLSVAPWMMFRYLTVLMPAAAIAMGLVAAWVWQRHRVAGAILVAILACTDLLHRAPLQWLNVPGTQSAERFPEIGLLAPLNTPDAQWAKVFALFPELGEVSFPILAYLHELRSPPEDPEWTVAKYLNREECSPDEIIHTTYGDLPIQFYTKLRVVGGLQNQPLPEDPDWFFIRGLLPTGGARRFDIHRHLWDYQIRLPLYDRVEFPKNRRDFYAGHNPDPQFHFFRVPPNPEDSTEVTLLRKKKVETEK